MDSVKLFSRNLLQLCVVIIRVFFKFSPCAYFIKDWSYFLNSFEIKLAHFGLKLDLLWKMACEILESQIPYCLSTFLISFVKYNILKQNSLHCLCSMNQKYLLFKSLSIFLEGRGSLCTNVWAIFTHTVCFHILHSENIMIRKLCISFLKYFYLFTCLCQVLVLACGILSCTCRIF